LDQKNIRIQHTQIYVSVKLTHSWVEVC